MSETNQTTNNLHEMWNKYLKYIAMGSTFLGLAGAASVISLFPSTESSTKDNFISKSNLLLAGILVPSLIGATIGFTFSVWKNYCQPKAVEVDLESSNFLELQTSLNPIPVYSRNENLPAYEESLDPAPPYPYEDRLPTFEEAMAMV